MNNYDNDVLGVGNSQHPANQVETEAEPIDTWENLTEAYYSGHEQAFIDVQSEIIVDLKDLLYILESMESGLTSRLKGIIEKIK